MKKPWIEVEGGRQLDGFLGAYGCKTSQFETNFEIIQEAARVFELEPTENVAEIASKIDALGRRERKVRASRNIQREDESVDLAGDVEPEEPIEKKLLHQVVMALTDAGQAHLLANLPEVLAYYGSRVPTVEEVIGGRPSNALITGGITFDDKVWRFSCSRLVARS